MLVFGDDCQSALLIALIHVPYFASLWVDLISLVDCWLKELWSSQGAGVTSGEPFGTQVQGGWWD
jgi:hypothetical protein